MDSLKLSNVNIQKFIDEINEFIEPLKLTKQNKIQLSLGLEEALLKYQDALGVDAEFSYKYKERFGTILVELYVDGKELDVLHPNLDQKEDVDLELVDNLFNTGDGQKLFRYKDGKNIISITYPLSGIKKKIPGYPMIPAIVLGIIVGLILRFVLPDFALTLNDNYVSPVYSSLMNMLKGVTEPVIFISLVVGICALDDLSTMSKVGKKILLAFLGISTIMFAMAVIACIIVFVNNGISVTSFNPAEILNLLLASIPSNIFSPFVEGNMIQIVILGFVSGIVILILGRKVPIIKKAINEFKFFFFTILEIVVKLLPFVVFLSVIKVALTLSFSNSLQIWKLIVVDVVLQVILGVGLLAVTSLKTKVSIKKLMQKIMPMVSTSFATGSSTAVIPEFYEALPNRLGIDEKFTNYWIPLSNAFFSPSTIFALIIYAFFAASMQGVGLSINWLIILYIMIIQIGMATPRIPGGIIASVTILFSQLGLNVEQLGLIMGANVIILYFDTAVASMIRSLGAILVAKKQGVIDLNKLKE